VAADPILAVKKGYGGML